MDDDGRPLWRLLVQRQAAVPQLLLVAVVMKTAAVCYAVHQPFISNQFFFDLARQKITGTEDDLSYAACRTNPADLPPDVQAACIEAPATATQFQSYNFAAQQFSGILWGVLAGRISDAVGRKLPIAVALLGEVAPVIPDYLYVATGSSLWYYWVTAIVGGCLIPQQMLDLAVRSAICDTMPAKHRTWLMGIYESALPIGLLIGAPIGSALSAERALLFAVIAMSTCCLWVLVITRETLPPDRRVPFLPSPDEAEHVEEEAEKAPGTEMVTLTPSGRREEGEDDSQGEGDGKPVAAPPPPPPSAARTSTLAKLRTLAREVAIGRMNPIRGLSILGRSRDLTLAALILLLSLYVHWTAITISGQFTVMEIGFTKTEITNKFVIGGISATVFTVVIGTLLQRWMGVKRAMLAAIVLSATQSVLFGLSNSALFVFIVVGFTAAPMIGPMVAGFASTAVEPNEQGQLQGAIAVVYSLMGGVASLVSAALFEKCSGGQGAWVDAPGLPFIVAGMVQLLALPLAFFLRPPERQAAV